MTSQFQFKTRPLPSKFKFDIERTLEVMKMIGEAAIDLRWLIVGGDSFDHPEFFETGFKNFGTSLKVFTLKLQRPDQYKMKILVFSIQYDFQILKYQYQYSI